MITMYIEYVYQIKHHHYVNRFNFIMFNKVYLPGALIAVLLMKCCPVIACLLFFG